MSSRFEWNIRGSWLHVPMLAVWIILWGAGCGDSTADDSGQSQQSGLVFSGTESIGPAEGAEQASEYKVKLAGKPAAPVTLNLYTDASQIDLELETIVFTPANWNSFQSVKLKAVDDPLIEGEHSAVVEHEMISEDDVYNVGTRPVVAVRITDNDAAGFYVFPNSQLSLDEGNVSGKSWSVFLTQKPESDVIVRLVADKESQINFSPSELVFQRAYWDQPLKFTVTAVDDGAIESQADNLVTLTHTIFSSDKNFQGLEPRILEVQILDNDSVLYVDGSLPLNGNGTSWDTAYNNLQDALGDAVAGQEIWVAQGVYQPSVTGDRSASFTLKEGVDLYGGFSGSETSRSQADWQQFPTILSGDLDNDDGIAGTAENSYHVVAAYNITFGSPVVVDGFFIEAGNTTGAGTENDGGGIWTNNAQVHFSNLLIRNNHSDDAGGGARIFGDANVTFSGVTFMNNTAVNTGGGLYLRVDDDPDRGVTLTDCSFQENEADLGGGFGIWNTQYGQHGTVWVEDSSFDNNTASSVGGGFYTTNVNITMKDNSFTGNTAVQGGAVFSTYSDFTIEGSSPGTDTACLFENNEATSTTNGEGGGAVYLINTNGGSSITGCQFTSNSAYDGGAVLFDGLGGTDVLTIDQSEFTSNEASDQGGAVHAAYDDNGSHEVHIIYSDFSQNQAATRGGAVYANMDEAFVHKLYISGSGFNANTAVADHGGALFAEGTGSGNLQDVRISDSTFDNNQAAQHGGAMELYEYVQYTITDTSFTGNSAGVFGGAIFLHQTWGTISDSGTTGKCFFESNAAVDEGGAIRMLNLNTATIDGCRFGAEGKGNSSQNDGGAIATEHDGAPDTLTIRNSTFSYNFAEQSGGALHLYDKGLGHQTIIEQTDFDHNTTNASGGAIKSWYHLVTVQGPASFSNNEAAADGGAVHFYQDQTAIDNGSEEIINFEDVSFTDNTANSGGAMYLREYTAVIRQSIFGNNHSEANGGAVYTTGDDEADNDMTFTNSLFYSNTSGGNGAAVYMTRYDSTDNHDNIFHNCTIVGNVGDLNNATKDTGALHVASPGVELFLYSSIVVGNNYVPTDPAYDNPIQVVAAGGSSGMNRHYLNSVVENNGTNNLAVNTGSGVTTDAVPVDFIPGAPGDWSGLFADAANEDFCPIASATILLDKGNTAHISETGGDLFGNPRWVDGDTLDTDGSGDGNLNEPDVGACEYQGGT
jgi:predicted outer membrane repeat protein